MSALNGPSPSLPQTSKPAKQNGSDRKPWMPPAQRLSFGRLACVLMLIGLGVLLGGCATNSPPSQVAAIPAPPRLSQPLPQESYSESARKKLDAWLGRLTGMPRM
jgi:hypothetical protein